LVIRNYGGRIAKANWNPIVVFPARALSPPAPAPDSDDAARGPDVSPGAGAGAAAISRTRLHEEVTARLRDLIVRNQLRPGERVPELEVAALLGVSRTPIREALKVLASEGLVDMQPLRGAIVRAFSAKDAQDMLRVIALLEEFAGREACAAPQPAIDAVLALHERMRGHFERREREPYFALNQRFHESVVALTANETLIATHATLAQRMRRIRYVGNSVPDNWGAAMAEHEAMAQALAARDADAMAQAMREHLMNTWPRIEQAAQRAAEGY
jgi:DNA-binding GntR family transcriptional regulator